MGESCGHVLQGAAGQLAAEVLASLGSHAPAASLFPALALMGRDGALAGSEQMQQVLGPVKARHGGLLPQAQLLVQRLREVACLQSEQWMHLLRDVQVCTAALLDQPHGTVSHGNGAIFPLCATCLALILAGPSNSCADVGETMWHLQGQQNRDGVLS